MTESYFLYIKVLVMMAMVLSITISYDIRKVNMA